MLELTYWETPTSARVIETLRGLAKHTHGLASGAAVRPCALIAVQRFRNDSSLRTSG